ncbi:MAG: DUF4258 domain-containing protein [Thermomicrobiales bacterium]
MDRKTQEMYVHTLEQAVLMVLEGRVRSSVHSKQRRDLRDIEVADAEAAILGRDAKVVSLNPAHPEGITYEVAGRRANGDVVHVVIAFDAEDVSQATMMTIVTVMYPHR